MNLPEARAFYEDVKQHQDNPDLRLGYQIVTSILNTSQNLTEARTRIQNVARTAPTPIRGIVYLEALSNIEENTSNE